jgi:ABC-type multidrug transport system ATPase subunit
MQITLNNTGKRYNREWIFRHIDYTFFASKKYAIVGANGSGKSTLLQVIAGATLHNEGTISFTTINNSTPVAPENMYKHISIAAPYLELIEEMTAEEFLQFHHALKPLQLSIAQILQTVQLQAAAHKQIRYYSSGMKQRLKLAQAFFSPSQILLLDEPTTNLDAAGIQLYQHLMANHTQKKLVIISSNDVQEYACCDAVLAIGDYK